MSFLQKLLFCARIACMPILELKEFRKALYSIIDIIFKRFIAYVLLIYKQIKIRGEMAHVESYNEYQILGSILDRLQGKDKWKQQKESHLYDWERIQSRL